MNKPKREPEPLNIFRQIVHEGAELGARQVVPKENLRVQALDDNIRESIHSSVDKYIDSNYREFMNNISEIFDFDQLTYSIACRYGVDPSEITDEFLREKREAREKEYRKFIRRVEKERGMKFKKDTPEYRKKLEQRVKKLIDMAPE